MIIFDTKNINNTIRNNFFRSIFDVKDNNIGPDMAKLNENMEINDPT